MAEESGTSGDAGGSGGSARPRRWLRVLLAVAVAALTQLARLDDRAHELLRHRGVVLAPVGVLLGLYILRIGLHVADNHWSRPSTRRWLVVESVLAAIFLGEFVRDVVAYHPLEFSIVTSVLLPCMIVVAIYQVDAIEQVPELRRGTETLPDLAWGRHVRMWIRRSRSLQSLLSVSVGRPSPTGELSTFIGVVLIGLFLCTMVGYSVAVMGPPKDTAGQTSVTAEPTPSATPSNDPDQQAEATPTPAPLTYADACGADLPGQGAPGDAARLLRDLWLGPDGAGATQAGCAAKAEQIRSETWVARGYCGVRLKSLAVANTHLEQGALLFEDAAVLANRLARRGQLISATPRQDVGVGDYYQLTTTAGPVVFARSDKTVPLSSRPTPSPEPCPGAVAGSAEVGSAPYSVLMPEAERLWKKEIRRVHEWLWPVADINGTTFTLITDLDRNIALGTIDCSDTTLYATCRIERPPPSPGK